MPLEELAQRRFRLQLPGRHDDLRIARLPILHRSGDGLDHRVVRVLDEGHARTGKKPDRLDSIHQQRGFLAQLHRRNPRKAHLAFTLRPDHRGNQLLPLERHAHRVFAIDQDAQLGRVGSGEIPRRLARGQLHAGRPLAEMTRRSTI